MQIHIFGNGIKKLELPKGIILGIKYHRKHSALDISYVFP